MTISVTTFKATIGVGSYRHYGYRRRVVGITAIGVVAIDFPFLSQKYKYQVKKRLALCS